MSISFKKIKTKWGSTPGIRDRKVAMSLSKLAKAHVGVLLTVLGFSLVYLVQVNALATKGYEIKEIQQTITEQKKANERISLDIIQAQSIQNLQKKMDDLKLVRSEKIEYIDASASVATAVRPTP
ncbi:hypothetical protein HY732_03735 [Candidatus Uhrbacteria bacterium]|nr:hypothetical protein [Candidatus Uhrbacteria bacterium]